MDFRLQRDEGGLEIRAGTNAGDDLEDDDPSPGVAARWEVDEEAGSKGADEGAEPDGGEVLTCLLDEDANDGGKEGEGHDEWNQVYAREYGGGAENGLKIQGKEISGGDEDHAVAEANQQGSDVGTMLEDA